ncbi:hypothetical protein HAX54_014128 [Datura stramonium]|uniref:Uncharacterized protein n=1 Tax=Datura stramonium TaxID=4076 RepID=A0ABS8TMK2_DATST|nr:hypothetical protein [Datura stramonium]
MLLNLRSSSLFSVVSHSCLSPPSATISSMYTRFAQEKTYQIAVRWNICKTEIDVINLQKQFADQIASLLSNPDEEIKTAT